MAGVYSVGQVNQYIKNMFAQDILLHKVTIKGEVSNCKYHSSGHIYFTLKDATGTLAAVMFAGQRKNLTFVLENGMQVLATGSVTVYERDGKYQLYVSQIVPDGEGDLYRRYQMLKNELEEMGMFSPEYKKPIPKFARKIGIVTAQTGAAIRDIMNIANRRNPYVQLILYSALVQGEGAAASVANGIRYLDEYGVDVLIVGRGGGSIEELWAFNEEEVARAIFECNTPVISAVGHETDFTIADFVSDLRAPTPSAAAELAVFDYQKTYQGILRYQQQLSQAMYQRMDTLYDCLNQYKIHLKYLSPLYVIAQKRQQLDSYQEKLSVLVNRKLSDSKNSFEIKVSKLEGLSPLKRLMSGYAFLEDENKQPVRSVSDVDKDDVLSIFVSDGEILSKVKSIRKK